MKPEIVIRSEVPADAPAIAEVTAAAFETLEVSSHTEHYIVEPLRKAGALTVSLVAEAQGRVVGHIAFSPGRTAPPLGPAFEVPSPLPRPGRGAAQRARRSPCRQKWKTSR